jgi:hypothetical protein
MKEQPLTLAPSVCVVIATDPGPAQLAAWRRLWALLLTGDPKDTPLHEAATPRSGE